VYNHRAAFDGRIEDVVQLTKAWNQEQHTQFDPQGNTVRYHTEHLGIASDSTLDHFLEVLVDQTVKPNIQSTPFTG
jgi:hypothetical protein